ncbi:deacetylase EF_0837-like isoform X1 [Mercenaria mercenaria]|uniref:deacetylase EF_0837-like isoform X1 n=1 Tax=Mercenaria mercenaria TaxID=6596 RepID=UPI001E1DD1A4|nr:deacetylase EF_0837-like isoform X1 [Mercenaria mercenaria]XP_045162394.1 deacetylase EF_0837-like isoform X1 [Mercenaria mercenaria]
MDTLIRNGRVIDPQNDIDDILDVAIKDGKIFAVGRNLQLNSKSTYDASGLIVTPGLIDAHVHCYQYATPLGINPDDACLARGVTTVIDAGSSGASTFLGLRKFIVDKSKTRVRCLLHIALHGLAAAGCSGGALGGESDTLAILDEEECVKCIQANRDVIVGVKVRLSASVCDNGRLEAEAFRRALSAAKRCAVPLMVHHVESTIPTQTDRASPSSLGCPKDLQAGDIYTHTYNGWRCSIVDPETKEIHSDVIEAKARGVLFDSGHGAGAFNWTVAEIAAKQNFWPNLMGSDLHTENQEGPAYDIPTVMTKFLHLGMPLNEIVRSVTSSPARAYSLNSIGSLSEGMDADVSVLRIDECDVNLEDTVGQKRNVKKRILPVAVWRDGKEHQVVLPTIWPNTNAIKRGLMINKHQIVKDKE